MKHIVNLVNITKDLIDVVLIVVDGILNVLQQCIEKENYEI